jgi:uncharacterized membrane protein YkgB
MAAYSTRNSTWRLGYAARSTQVVVVIGVPDGIRTRVIAVKGGFLYLARVRVTLHLFIKCR